ncbi:MAG TPA: serine protein kinase RIO [Candidatus Lokiarchaeia archaeon]|nr:serine protein kinase RIO [Candidatus Lokiarchaeia archaeon]
MPERKKQRVDTKKIDEMLVDKVDKRRERIKDSSDRQALEAVMSPRISRIIFDLEAKGKLKNIIGILNAGKEANVYNGTTPDGREVAIKVWRINSQTSKWMQDYIRGDPRFKTYHKRNSTSLMTTWAMKEFKNLRRARDAGVPCPEPIVVRENVLVMEFIGKEGTPAKRLVDVELKDPLKHLNVILQGIEDLIIKARLVHGDLSAFNILYDENKDQVYFIDFAQGVLMDHPNSRKYFNRDIDNVLGYFSNVLPEGFDKEALMNAIIAGKPIKIE